MKKILKKIIVTIVCSIIFSFPAIAKYHYKIAFETIPTSLNIANFSNLEVYFLLRQLNETLFYLGMNGYRSNILKSWKAENNHKNYELCPGDNITFSNNKTFTAEELIKNLKLYSNKLTKKIVSTNIINNCVKIEFNSSYPTFPIEMDTYEMPIIDVSSINDKVQIGISPYVVTEYTEKKIQLETRDNLLNKPDVTEITVFPMSDIKNYDKIDELNYVVPNENIKVEQQKMAVYENSVVKGTYLLINTKNEQVRNIFWNCFEKDLFLPYTNPELKFSKLNTILPPGIPFVEPIEIKRNCKFAKLSKKVKLTFLAEDFKKEEADKTLEYLNSKLNKHNIEIVLQNVHWEDINRLSSDKNKNYDLAIMVITGRLPHHYLSVFLYGDDKTRRVSNFYKVDLNKTHVNILENSTKWKNEIAKLTKKVIENKNVLPLGIRQTKLFYPKNIVIPNTESYFDLMEYKIKDIKVK